MRPLGFAASSAAIPRGPTRQAGGLYLTTKPFRFERPIFRLLQLYRVPEILTLGRLNEAAVAALRFVAELGVHQHPWRGTLEINRPRQLDKRSVG